MAMLIDEACTRVEIIITIALMNIPHRRPHRSESGPQTKDPTMLPMAYIEKMRPVELPVPFKWKYLM